ncbi:NAD-P-binding protein [Amylostereum chailletii]|nr:NAD-P-binding protein [Amylostereum chailletii]
MPHTVWLVTGASTGLGLALVLRALARGDCVIATARDVGRFDPILVSLTEAERSRIHPLRLDVTAPFGEIEEVMKRAVERWGHVDVLVNNAGVNLGVGVSEELGADQMMRVMQTNFAGVINVTNALLPYMRGRKSGTVVVVGSRSAYRNEFPVLAYAASKAAVHSYGETLAAEVRPWNIRVTILVPGTFDTAMNIPPITGRPITDYDDMRKSMALMLQMLKDKPHKGDPTKGMDVVVDLVHGEGRAKGKAHWPLWLFLGEDSVSDAKARAAKLRETVEEWESAGVGLAIESATNVGPGRFEEPPIVR